MKPNPACKECDGRGISFYSPLERGQDIFACTGCWPRNGDSEQPANIVVGLTQAPSYTVPQILHAAAETYAERNAVYGDNYKRFGAALLACFGGEVHITTEDEANRLGILVQLLSKITRYGQSFKDGHIDSAHDASVYAAMLEELTHEHQQASRANQD